MNSYKLILVVGAALMLLASLAMCFVVYFHSSGRSRRNNLYCFFVFMVAVWGISFELPPMLYNDINSIERVVKVSQIIGCFTALSFSMLASSFIKSTRIRRFSEVFSLFATMSGVYLVTSSTIIAKLVFDVSTRTYSYEYSDELPMILVAEVLTLCVPIVLSYLKGGRPLYKEDIKLKKQFLISSFMYLASLLVFTYLIPLYVGNSIAVEYSIFNVITIVFIFIVSRQLLRNGTIDIKQRRTRIILTTIIRYVSALLVLTLSELLFSNFNQGKSLIFIRITVYPILLFLVWYFGTQLSLRLLTRFDLNMKRLNQELQQLRGILDVDLLREKFCQILLNELHTKDVLMFGGTDDDILAEKDVYSKSKLGRPFVASQKTLRDIDYIFAGTSGQNFIKDLSSHDLLRYGLEQFSLGIAFRNDSMYGAVFVTTKTNKQNYDSVDEAMFSLSVSEYSLLAQAARQYTEIKQYSNALRQEIEKTNLQLKKSSKKLAEIDDAKDEFINMASHQLRTPLTSVKGYVSMVLDGDEGALNTTQQYMLGQAYSNSQRMSYLISDLLSLSKLRNGKFVLNKKTSQLADIVRGEIEQLKESLVVKNQIIDYKCSGDIPKLELDVSKIRQAIMHLLLNAIYYSHQGKKIIVTLKVHGHNIELLVEDFGIGIPKDSKEFIFDKYYRAPNAQRMMPDGTGIGLYMAKRIVESHGGTMTFMTRLNRGSTFGFTIPLE